MYNVVTAVSRKDWEETKKKIPPLKLRINDPLYDIEAYAQAGQVTLPFFGQAVNAASKTLEDTNLLQAGRVPDSIDFVLTGFMLKPLPNAAIMGIAYVEDCKKMLEKGALVVQINQQPIRTFAPLWQAVGGGLVGTAFATADGTTSKFFSYATERTQTDNRIDPYLALPGGTQIAASATWATAAAIAAAGRMGLYFLGHQIQLS